MDIKKATTAYESWLEGRIPFIDADLCLKHQRMAQSPFPFLRATFYRWVQLWPQVCPELATAPAVLGVGDLHVENFGTWRGGWIAREAKELVVSAWHWETESRKGTGILYQRAIDQAVRVPDPFIRLNGQWLIRRLAPDCSRIELASLPNTRDQLKLLHAMGWETANIHLGTKAVVGRVLKDLNQRPVKWLRRAAEVMAKATLEDWKGLAKPHSQQPQAPR
jgi:hypothetical protein